ncbi:MAG: hypothetical protein ABFR62_00720, partial [Bacteroidota bacterium]
MKKVIFIMLILPLFLTAQPKEVVTNGNGGGSLRPCDTPNPPPQCGDAAPIDNYLYIGIMILGGVAIVV